MSASEGEKIQERVNDLREQLRNERKQEFDDLKSRYQLMFNNFIKEKEYEKYKNEEEIDIDHLYHYEDGDGYCKFYEYSIIKEYEFNKFSIYKEIHILVKEFINNLNQTDLANYKAYKNREYSIKLSNNYNVFRIMSGMA